MKKVDTTNGITIEAVSSQKQGLIGDSHKDQAEQLPLAIQRTENVIGKKIKIIKDYRLTGSRRVDLDLQPLYKVLQDAKDLKPKPEFAFLKSVDRSTRSGALIYAQLKALFVKEGIQIVDVYGVISTQSINTLAHHDIEYEWSKYSPTYITELLEAERAHSEVRDILTRLIGSEIAYTRLGFWIGQAPLGYQIIKKMTSHGKRTVLAPHPVKSKWFIRMFELAADGKSYSEICDEINDMGYESRKRNKFDSKDKTKIIGHTGGLKLIPKQLERYLRDTIYCGVMTHKWLKKPMKSIEFEGLVSIDLFNRANKGKIGVAIINNEVKIYKGKVPSYQLIKNSANPLYPYKKYVQCPICEKPLMGSAPNKGQDGLRNASYHCDRHRPMFRVRLQVFNDVIKEFVKHVKFSDKFLSDLREAIILDWQKKRGQIVEISISLTDRLKDIEVEEKQINETLPRLTSLNAIKAQEARLDKLVAERDEIEVKKSEKNLEQADVQYVINRAFYFLEHPEETLLDKKNPQKSAALFSTIFDIPPTYEELKSRTDSIVAKMNSVFQLNEAYNHTGNLVVDTLSHGWNTLFESILRVHQKLKELDLFYYTQNEEENHHE